MVDAFDRKLEAAMCDHWSVPSDVEIIRRPEIEYLHSQRDSCAYNAVIRIDPNLADHGKLVDEFMGAVNGRRSEWRIGAPSYSMGLEKAVVAAGYRLEAEADAWSIDVNAPRPRLPRGIRINPVTTIEDLKALRTVFMAAFDRFDEDELDPIEEDLKRCTPPDGRTIRFVAYDDASNQPLSSGALDVFPQLGIGFMWGGSTIEAARGRGLYSALITTRMEAARQLGLERMGLYALRNTSGAIIEKQGFQRHGTCHFWM